jgi:hypothetical protein
VRAELYGEEIRVASRDKDLFSLVVESANESLPSVDHLYFIEEKDSSGTVEF